MVDGEQRSLVLLDGELCFKQVAVNNCTLCDRAMVSMFNQAQVSVQALSITAIDTVPPNKGMEAAQPSMLLPATSGTLGNQVTRLRRRRARSSKTAIRFAGFSCCLLCMAKACQNQGGQSRSSQQGTNKEKVLQDNLAQHQ